MAKSDVIYFNPFILKFFDRNPFVAEERNYPVDFGFPRAYQYLLNLEIPSGYKLKSQPISKMYSLPDNSGFVKIDSEENANGVLNLLFNFEINTVHNKSDTYTDLKKMFTEVVMIQNQSLVVLEKKDAPLTKSE